jgi:hypothetical protein
MHQISDFGENLHLLTFDFSTELHIPIHSDWLEKSPEKTR